MTSASDEVDPRRDKPGGSPPCEGTTGPTNARWRAGNFLVALGLVLLTCGAYGRIWVEDYQFVNADDDRFVTENPYVRNGLTVEGIRWAMTTFHAADWFPLTWLSLQVDAQLYGLNPRGFHITNLVLHALNAVLVFLVLQRLTGARWRSAIVAAFFAVHPLRVESVAWVAERKDVLSGFFWLLTLWAYAWYVTRPGWRRYLLVVVLFGLGLLAKQMLVTLPFVLLLLDYWPLRRFEQGPRLSSALGRLSLEKVPLVLLAAGVCVLALRSHAQVIESTDVVTIPQRLANVLITYAGYISTMFWPTGLALFYPLAPEELTFGRAAGAGLLLVALSWLALANARRRPYLLVGWLWYLGTLVPVVGIVQIGIQVRPDRYTYLPLLGLFIALTWGVSELVAGRRLLRLAAAGAAVALVGACAVATWRQSVYWRDNLTLWPRTLAVTRNNGTAHLCLALALEKAERDEEAEYHYGQAIEKNKPAAHAFLGDFLRRRGRLAEARQHLQAGAAVLPDNVAVHFNLALVLLRQEDWSAARQELEEVVRLAPDHADGHYSLGTTLFKLGELDRAEDHLLRALARQPNHVDARYKLGTVLMLRGQLRQAWEQFGIVLDREPRHSGALVGRGVILARTGQAEKAQSFFERALAADPRSAEAHFLLAAGLQAHGELAEAERHLTAAVELDPGYTTARLALAQLQMRQGGARKGLHHLEEAVRRDPQRADAHVALAAAYAEAGRFPDAAAVARKALALAEAGRRDDLARQVRQRLDDYERRRPLEPGR
jgi:tetratricopeptide (TPR) repeat protein